MSHPYFLAVPERALTEEEHALLERLLQDQHAVFRKQIEQLTVVGRCGCGNCPTIFFRAHTLGASEHDLVSMQGIDEQGGLVGVILLRDGDVLTQLEFYSVDGHDPWSIPKPEKLTLIY